MSSEQIIKYKISEKKIKALFAIKFLNNLNKSYSNPKIIPNKKKQANTKIEDIFLLFKQIFEKIFGKFARIHIT